MRILLIVLSAALLVSIAINTSQAASVEWLNGAAAFGVSADGTVVVGEGVLTPFGWSSQAFAWTAAGGITPLTSTGNGSARAASADGSVIAGFEVIGSNVWGRYWMNGIGSTIGPPPGSQIGWVLPRAVSQGGIIIVGSSRGAAHAGHLAFRWTSATGTVALPDLGATGDSAATDISGDNLTTVGYSRDENGDRVAVRWNAAGVSVIGDLPGGEVSSSAVAASFDASVIVGSSSSAATGVAYEPFRWTETTGMVGLGRLGRPYGTATALSADGSVVIGYMSTTTVDEDDAFIWTEPGGTRLLSDFLAEMGVHLGTSELLRAEAISADGTVIVGTGRLNGNEHAFVVTVPEPSAGLAAGLVMLALSPRRRAPSRPKRAVNP